MTEYTAKMLTPSSVYNAFNPFSYLAIAYALEKVHKVGTTYQPYPWANQITLLNVMAIVASITIYYFKHEAQSVSGVYFWSMKVFNWGTLLRLLSIHLMRYFNAKTSSEIYFGLDSFDKEMGTLGKSSEITKANKQLRQFAIIAVPASVAIYILSEIYINVVGEADLSLLVIISRFIGTYVGILAKMQFYLWCTALKQRFTMVNDLLMKMTDQSERSDMFVIDACVYKYEQCIEKCADLHRELTQLARRVNDMYQFDMLWHFFVMFVVSFTNAYYFAFMMLSRESKFNYGAIISNFLFVMFEIVVSIQPSTELCNESYVALDIFNHLQVDPDDNSIQRLVISSIYELKENKLEITACRFFNINFSTLAVMFTLITNYVFILIQFEDTNMASPTAISTTTSDAFI